MKIHGADQAVRDLTRWNRAGLSRVRYIEGGAAEWLEYLRVAHMLLYARDRATAPSENPDAWRQAFETGALEGTPVTGAAAALRTAWQQPAPQAYLKGAGDYRAALRAQYDRIPLDQTAQIQRAFVRAFHILTETLDAYANEGYLPTATQPPHLRRLLEQIAFQPRLAASARVPVALTIVAATPRQFVDRGLAVEYLPTDGLGALTFESLDALIVDPGLNLLRPLGHDQRRDTISAAATVFPLADTGVLNVALTGTLGLLFQDAEIQGVLVTAASKATGTVTVARGLPPVTAATWQEAAMALAPARLLPARPLGPTWLHFTAPPACYVGQLVSLKLTPPELRFAAEGSSGSETSGAIGGISMFGADAFAGFDAIGAFAGFILGNLATVLEVRGADVRIDKSVPARLEAVYPAVRSVVVDNPSDHAEGDFDVLVLGPYVTPAGAEPVGTLATLAGARVHIAAPPPEGLKAGDPVALRLADGRVAGGRIASITPGGTDGFALGLTLPAGVDFADVVSVAMLFGASPGFLHETRSDAALFPASGALDVIVPDMFDDLMKPGRVLLVAPDPATATPDDRGTGMAITIATAARAGDNLQLTFAEDLSSLAAFRRGHTVLYGNVPVLGHGKSLPEKVLGSGDASIAAQAMTLPAADIATRPDPGFPGGVIPDIEVKVDGRKLRLVSNAAEADPLQPAYLVRLTDTGAAEALFLSRLPTRADNVRLTRFRQGAGQRGNAVPPFAIVKTTPKVPIIATVIQPLAPQFGADIEGAETLRSQGGSYFALLDRALSARDFERLAESSASVWHAHVDLRREAGSQGQPTVVLTVVPAGDGAVEPIRDDLTRFLTDRALPGTVLDIQPFRPAPVKGTATVTLFAGYARDITIAEEIQAAVYGALKLEARALGRTLFVAEIVAVIEAHEAVDSVSFTLVPDWPATDPPRVVTSAAGAIQAVMPRATQAVFVAAPEDMAITLNGDAA